MKFLKTLFTGDYKAFSDEKSYKIFFATNLFLIMYISVHIFYVALFTYLNMSFMIFLEFISIIILAGAIYINRKQVKYIPALILCIEAGANAVLWSMFFESPNRHYLYIFIALLAIYLFFELKTYQKTIITIYFFVCLNVAFVLENGRISFIHKEASWISLFSINMIFIIIIIELTMTGMTNNAIKAMHKEAIKKMEIEIIQDPLTKVYNRRYFQRNEQNFNKIAENNSCCVVMLDIDNFKKINDKYGHNAGDKVLVFFADKMINEFRAYDVIMRWGGEEFVILLNNISIENATKKLNNFRTTIQNSIISLEHTKINVTFTAGICKVKSGMNISEAISHADKYLYNGKNNGRNCVVHK